MTIHTRAMQGVDNLVACTIVAKNYLSYARVLAESFLAHHPESRIYVLLVDHVDGCFSPEHEKFSLVTLDHLDITDMPSMCFKYTVTELSTAVKPFLLDYLCRKLGHKKVAYFDPDILITDGLPTISELLDDHSIVLIPHLTDPIDDDRKPAEIDILMAGSYNLGFIAISWTQTTDRFLAWWQKRLRHYCVSRPDQGLFVDQKWIDLVPGLFKDVHILTEPGYNVAYWNLHGRQISSNARNRYEVNGKPLYFFHFSGLNPGDPSCISKHQTRLTFQGREHLRALFSCYRERLQRNGYEATRQWSYSFGAFDNGVKLCDFIRCLYHALGEKGRKYGDPFAAIGAGSFFSWLTAPKKRHVSGAVLTNLHYELYRSRPDIMVAYPDILGAHFEDVARWLVESSRVEYNLDPMFVGTLLPALQRGPSAAGLRTRVFTFLKRYRSSILFQRAKFVFRYLLGEATYQKLLLSFRRVASSQNHTPNNLGFPFHQQRSRLPVISRVGMNISGYITAETGVGEGVRANIRAAKAVGIPYTLNNFEVCLSRKADETFAAEFLEQNPYDINLIQVNAEQVPVFINHKGPEYFEDKYNIGYWAWELSEFPKEWSDRFRYFHELWTYSTFCQQAFASASPIPVVRIMPALEIHMPKEFKRAHFGLPEDRFLFLFMFDFYSVFERKNPLAVVKAFQQAFSHRDPVSLVLKFSNADVDPMSKQRLVEAAAGSAVRLWDGYLSRSEVHGLLACCDAYVSLHRSEGFGLTVAEAMYFGKPVITTNYGATTDFANVNNSFPVRYSIQEIEQDQGPYKRGFVWADPDVQDAARWMRFVYDNRDVACAVGGRAAHDIHRLLAPKVIGEQIQRRLETILQHSQGGA